MTSEINPYRPVVRTDAGKEATSSLSFDGVIEEADYVEFFPLRRSATSLLRILVALLATLTVGIVAIVIYAVASRGFSLRALSVAPVALMMMLMIASLFWALRPQLRARRQLKHNQDLLGRAQGALNASGVTFFDGVRTHWFSGAMMAESRITSQGIRLPLDKNPYRYLALHERLFEQYSEVAANSLATKWKAAAETAIAAGPKIGFGDSADLREGEFPEAAFAPPSGPNWQPPQEADASIRFAGQVTAQVSTRTPQMKTRLKTEGVSTVALIAASVLTAALGKWFLAAACLIPAISGMVGLFRLLKQYRSGSETTTWLQSGWINADEFVWRNESHGIRYPHQEITNASQADDLLTLTLGNVSYLIPRAQLLNADQWVSLQTLCQRSGG